MELYNWLGDVHFDPNLRPIADLRGAVAQAHAAPGDQADAVKPFADHVKCDILLVAAELGRIFIPATAVLRVPQFDQRNARRADFLDLVIERDPFAADQLTFLVARPVEDILGPIVVVGQDAGLRLATADVASGVVAAAAAI